MPTLDLINYAARLCGMPPRDERGEIARLVAARDLAELDRIIDATGREQDRLWTQLADSEATLGILYRQHRAMRQRHAEALRAYQYALRGEALPEDSGRDDAP